MKLYFAILVLFITVTSCSDDENINFNERNETEILNYLRENNLEAQKSESGLYYIINKLGEGEEHPSSTSDVTVRYQGYFTNGEVFDANEDGITFNLQQVITGWTEGITYFKKGGSGMLLIPSKLGYGKNGRPGIPGGSVLLFDIELLSVK